jgi:anti-sigma regulatory factor (Ser/Thr protein kinase)
MPEAETNTFRSELFFEKGSDLGEELRRLSDWLEDIDAFLRTLPGLEARGLSDLRMVCDELGSNAIRHAAAKKAIRLVVEIESFPGVVGLRLSDDGEEFNPFGRPVPYTGADLAKRNVGGLGLYLISKLFPRARYRRADGLNIVEVEYHADGSTRNRSTRMFTNPAK